MLKLSTLTVLPQKIILEQDKHPEISLIKRWKLEDKKPEWSKIAKFGLDLKSYWMEWDSLILRDNLLYRTMVIADSEEPRYQIVLPQSNCWSFRGPKDLSKNQTEVLLV